MRRTTDGLVQRKIVNNASTTSSGIGSATSNRSDDDSSRVVARNDQDADAKETRLTLMEEVLLLGLKDKEVSCIKLSHDS